MDKLELTLHKTTRGYFGQQVAFDIPMSIYPTKSKCIIINSPGASEPKDGRKNRWDTLGRHLQQKEIATFITYNPPPPDAEGKFPTEPFSYQDTSWNQLLVESLAHVIDYTLENSKDICDLDSPTIYLAGFSAGGSTCGAIAYLYPQVERILLVSAYDSVGDVFYNGIRRFKGEIFMAYGALDYLAGFLAYTMQFLAGEAKILHTQEIPDCNHSFSGATNSKILSNAFTWAFAGDVNFPNPDGGLLLYHE